MKRRLKFHLTSSLLIMVLAPATWYILQFYWQDKTKKLYNEAQNSYQKKYAYTYIRGVLNQTLYADNQENGRKLLSYYNQKTSYYNKVKLGEIEMKKYVSPISGDTVFHDGITIPVPLKFLGVPKTVYIKEDSELDSLVKIYVFNTQCWGYFEAYVPRYNLHDSLPPELVLKDLKKPVKSAPQQDGIYGTPSPYGFYCN